MLAGQKRAKSNNIQKEGGGRKKVTKYKLSYDVDYFSLLVTFDINIMT